MKASVCIEMIFTEYPFLDRIKIAADLGFDAVEFWRWRDKDLAEIKQIADKAGIRIAAFVSNRGYTLTNPGDRKIFIAGIRQSLSQAKEMDVERLILLTSGFDEDQGVSLDIPEFSYEEQRRSVLEGLLSLAPLAEAEEVILVLEPLNRIMDHPDYWLTYSKDGFDLVREVNSMNLKLLFDIYHQQVSEGNLIQNMVNNIDAIGHIHIADVPGRHQPGTGEINFPVVISKLREAGYMGYVGIEFIPTKPSREAARKALTLIRG